MHAYQQLMNKRASYFDLNNQPSEIKELMFGVAVTEAKKGNTDIRDLLQMNQDINSGGLMMLPN